MPARAAWAVVRQSPSPGAPVAHRLFIFADTPGQEAVCKVAGTSRAWLSRTKQG
jgi:hypothetical protein